MPNRTRQPHGSRAAYEDWLSAPQTAIELADSRTDMPPVFTDGFQVIAPDGLPTVSTEGGVARMDSGSITVAADRGLYNQTDGSLPFYDGDLAGQNLLTNTGFELDTADWSVGGDGNATLARSTSAGDFLYGIAGATLTKTTGTGTLIAKAGQYAVTPGHTITFTLFLRTKVTARTAAVRLEWHAADGSIIATTNGVSSADTTSFGLRVVSGTAPAGTAYCIPFALWASVVNAEVHVIDAAALWDRTAFEQAGWAFTGCTPYLVNSGATYVDIGDGTELVGTTDVLYLLSTVTSGSMKLDGPKLPYSPVLAYESSHQVLGDTNADTFQSLLYFYDADGGTLQVDGGNLNQELSTSRYARGSNFVTGGSGRALEGGGLDVPATTSARLEVPVTAVTQYAYVYHLRLTSGGTVRGHVDPVGAINHLKAGRVSLTDTTGTATAATDTTVTGFPMSIAALVAASSPAAYLDIDNRSYLFVYCWETDAVNIGAASQTSFQPAYSLDGGATYVNDGTGTAIAIAAAAGYQLIAHATVSGVLLLPGGSSPYLRLNFQHSTTATATSVARGRLVWTLLPA